MKSVPRCFVGEINANGSNERSILVALIVYLTGITLFDNRQTAVCCKGYDS